MAACFFTLQVHVHFPLFAHIVFQENLSAQEVASCNTICPN